MLLQQQRLWHQLTGLEGSAGEERGGGSVHGGGDGGGDDELRWEEDKSQKVSPLCRILKDWHS